MTWSMEFRNEMNETYRVQCRKPLMYPWNTPLFDRGWTLQEHLISRRIIHFMEQELWWECSKRGTCECTSGENPHLGFKARKRLPPMLREDPSKEQFDQLWQNIVEEYTAKSFTYAVYEQVHLPSCDNRRCSTGM
jgi:hypothetical protein